MTDTSDPNGFCTNDFEWCAIPYGKEKYIIVHRGQQVHLCRSFKTAQNFIQNKSK